MFYILEYNDGWHVTNHVKKFETLAEAEAFCKSETAGMLSDNPYYIVSVIGVLPSDMKEEMDKWLDHLFKIGNTGWMRIHQIREERYRVECTFTTGPLNGVSCFLDLF